MNERYGVVVGTLGPSQAEAVAELGTGAIRIGFNWAERQPERGGPIDFSDLDAQLTRATDLTTLVTLEHSPSWAAPTRQHPPDIDAWREFVAAVLERYRDYPGDVIWGIWNEPNGDQFFVDDDKATHYGELFRAAHTARERVSPNATLAGPETAYHAAKRRWWGTPYLVHAMRRIMPVMKPQDVVTVHWYDSPDAPPLAEYMRTVAALAGDHELWLTEANGPSTGDDAAQEHYVAKILHTMDAAATPSWTKTFVYVLQDGIPNGMGIIDPEWVRRTAFHWYRTYIATRSA